FMSNSLGSEENKTQLKISDGDTNIDIITIMFVDVNDRIFSIRSFALFLGSMYSPYTPQENPTERANRTNKTMMAQVARNQHNKWDECIPEISLSLNTSNSESTGYRPAYLVQGRVPRLPAALYDEVELGTSTAKHNPESKAKELQEIYKIVRHHLCRSAKDKRIHYNLRRRPWKPMIGDLVLVRQHPLSKAVASYAAKLAPKYDGTYEVLNFVSPVIVRVRDSLTYGCRNAHCRSAATALIYTYPPSLPT
ncbi:uncharacterized protein LOC133331084, partial [Musca vetustissima]|uniref:uncharacterized protein LOC133331084 n=1 Tax=Musca vetustissima TaxID=27455 RepID=UPI002AB6C283